MREMMLAFVMALALPCSTRGALALVQQGTPAREPSQKEGQQTGGRMYSPHKIGELSSVYSEIADDLRIQYQLGYNSTNRAHDGQWREIRVAISNHPEAVVRTRKGYYARKDGRRV